MNKPFTPKQMNAWCVLCDGSPIHGIFNARAVLREGGIPQGSHDGYIALFEQTAPHHIERVGRCMWKWVFEDETVSE